MDRKKWIKRMTTPHPRVIECSGLFFVFVVCVLGGLTLWNLPSSQWTRTELLPILNVVISALGVASLLFLWAQLRHSATLNKLLAYHNYFQDLPKERKVSALYAALARVGVQVPLWQTPLSPEDKTALLNDNEPPPNAAHLAAREYLNDFEEFAAAVNCGLVDDNYAYHLESARALNAYFGFRELIDHWLAEDQQRAARHRAAGVAPTDYYGELKKLAVRWKERKLEDMAELERRRKGITQVL